MENNINQCIQLIDELFESGNWCPNVPKFQTWPILFEYEEFFPFAETFLNSCRLYLNTSSIKYKKVQSWCYANFNVNENDLWHNHCSGGASLSGLFYLRNPERVGTEFIDAPGILPEDYCWYIYPSYLYHKPQNFNSKIKRYSLAADLYLE